MSQAFAAFKSSSMPKKPTLYIFPYVKRKKVIHVFGWSLIIPLDSASVTSILGFGKSNATEVQVSLVKTSGQVKQLILNILQDQISGISNPLNVLKLPLNGKQEIRQWQ